MVGVQVLRGSGGYTPSEAWAVARRSDIGNDGTSPLIVCGHGAGGGPGQFIDLGGMGFPAHVYALAMAGYTVVAGDDGGATSWASDTAIAAVINRAAWAQSTYGAKAGKWGYLGYSMGGALGWNVLTRYAAQIAAMVLFEPASDLTDFYGASAWSNQTANMDAAYGGNFATGGVGHRPSQDLVAAIAAAGIPVAVFQGDEQEASSVSTNPVRPSKQAAFMAAVAAAGGGPRVAMRTLPGANHVTLPFYVSPDVVARFMRAAGLYR